ncbi:hypothetical protein AX17_003034 [Amanita inopinata Kibby_2008]|nr:hypothetical protein AX17_003034 [Amanita inopinata Kibby_2008]
MRINVSAENSDKVIWFKERYLGDEEIIEHLIHNPSKTVCWTIHRPKRGWYIRLRHPSFHPGASIPFVPLPPSSPYHVDGALSFTSRTDVPHHVATPSVGSNKQFDIQDNAGTSSPTNLHSYPPTPPTVSVVIHPPSPEPDSTPKDADVKNQAKATPRTTPSGSPRPMQVTQFILAPHSVAPQTTDASSSFFSRALSALKNHRPSHSRSFTLSRIPPPIHNSPPPPYTSQSTLTLTSSEPKTEADTIQPLKPFLVLHDRTPVLTVGSFTGLIELDQVEERMFGVDRSFWIAVALTYLEFLEQRESYLVAAAD